MTQEEKLIKSGDLLVDFWNLYVETVNQIDNPYVKERQGLFLAEAAYCVHNLQGRMSLLKDHIKG